MTTITHTPDGPRFDGMTVGEVISTLDAAAAFCEGNGSQLFDIAAAALRHMSEWQPIETKGTENASED